MFCNLWGFMYEFRNYLSYSQMNLITHRYMCSFTNRMARMSLKKNSFGEENFNLYYLKKYAGIIDYFK